MTIIISHRRYETIKKIVAQMYETYDITCVPLNGFEIASKMGVKLIPYSAIAESKRMLLFKESLDGFCVESYSGEWSIYFNDKVSFGRLNNTIMHEIGHIILDHSEDSELAEKEVRFFAKFALAPPVLIDKYNLVSIEDIANIFQISLQAAEYAYNYYKKWRRNRSSEYTDYEEVILRLFAHAS